ncbi:hypothetical protein FHG87_019181 [Trinorchestia longiramus]|nr:hypothetical protein FHG87_019181 [Trinorchestia longiramus]
MNGVQQEAYRFLPDLGNSDSAEYSHGVPSLPHTSRHLYPSPSLPPDARIDSASQGAARSSSSSSSTTVRGRGARVKRGATTLQQKNVFLLVDEVQIRPTVSISGGLLSGMAENMSILTTTLTQYAVNPSNLLSTPQRKTSRRMQSFRPLSRWPDWLTNRCSLNTLRFPPPELLAGYCCPSLDPRATAPHGRGAAAAAALRAAPWLALSILASGGRDEAHSHITTTLITNNRYPTTTTTVNGDCHNSLPEEEVRCGMERRQNICRVRLQVLHSSAGYA